MNTEKPWLSEPNREQFPHNGYACVILRGPVGALCGYVGVLPEHPLYGKDYHHRIFVLPSWGKQPIGKRGVIPLILNAGNKDGTVSIDCYFNVHGGITYAANRAPDEDWSARWWFGFDCSHCDDLCPDLMRPDFLSIMAYPREGQVYRDIEYVRQECRSLADQLHTFTTWRQRAFTAYARCLVAVKEFLGTKFRKSP